MLAFLKEYLRPSLPLPLVIALAIGVLWLWSRRESRAARVYLLLLTCGYALAATRLGASLFLRPLAPALTRIDTRDAAGGADTIVLLGAGIGTATVGGQSVGVPTASSLLRALEAARVFKAIDARLLIASGGMPRPDRQTMSESAVLRSIVVDAGVPARAVIEESTSTTTAEQATLVRRMLRSRGVRRVVVVTSPAHMRRSLDLFRGDGVDAVGSMAPLRSEQVAPPPWLLPNAESLSISDDAMYEYAALTYYALRRFGPAK